MPPCRRSPAPLRILNVTQSYFPFLDRGGPAMKVRALARGLSARGHEVTVLTTDLGLEQHGEAIALTPSPFGWRSRADGFRTFYLRPVSIYRSLTWNPSVYSFCREHIGSFDVVHIFGLYDLMAPVVARFCRQQMIPYLVEPMGMFRPIVRNILLKRVYRRLFGDALMAGAAAVIATAIQEQGELIEGGVPADKIVVRRNGVEFPSSLPESGSFRSRFRIPQDALLVLFLGRLVSKKSPDLLIEAFAHCAARNPRLANAVLVLAGPDEADGYQEQLQALAARLDIQSQVRFTGPVYGATKWAAYRDADLFVLPSRNENFGNTAAEAVACGTPVLLTDRCGVATLIENRAGLVVAHDPGALARGLERLLSDQALRLQFAQACREVARELGWDQPLDQTELLYSALIARPNHSGVGD